MSSFIVTQIFLSVINKCSRVVNKRNVHLIYSLKVVTCCLEGLANPINKAKRKDEGIILQYTKMKKMPIIHSPHTNVYFTTEAECVMGFMHKCIQESILRSSYCFLQTPTLDQSKARICEKRGSICYSQCMPLCSLCTTCPVCLP